MKAKNKTDLTFFNLRLPGYLWCAFQSFLILDKGRPYLIVKAVIRLSDPAVMDLVSKK